MTLYLEMMPTMMLKTYHFKVIPMEDGVGKSFGVGRSFDIQEINWSVLSCALDGHENGRRKTVY